MSNPQKNPTDVYSFPPIEDDNIYATTPKQMLAIHDLPEIARMLARLLIIFFIFMLIFLIAIPWQQTSSGTGKVMAYLPQDRVQNVHATVPGRIKKWFVQEGTEVKKGDPILELVDIDPKFLERINIEKDAAQSNYDAAKSVTTTAKIDMDRQTNLFKKGISARKDMEQAIIAFKTAQSSEAQALSQLTQAESKISRQQSQIVEAQADGTLARLLVGSSNVVVEQGQVVAVFVPKSEQLAVELFVSGNDIPLIYEGRPTRLQFSGWPAVQFAGWPSVAIGTFGGVVKFVDRTATPDGSFRVIIVPGKNKWPESRYIRQGIQVNGWIQLNQVSLGYEIWRQFNNFPPSMDKAPTGLGTPDLNVPE